MENDYELIMLYQEKDEIAEKILFDKYQKIICLIINKYRNVIYKLGIDTKEIYSLCIKKFYQALEDFDVRKDANFNTYITTILKRTIKKFIIQASRGKNKVNIDNESYDKCSILNFLEDPLNQVMEKEESKELNDKIMEALNKQELLIYSYAVQGYNYKEIAERMNASYSSIIRLKNKMKKKIELVLENY